MAIIFTGTQTSTVTATTGDTYFTSATDTLSSSSGAAFDISYFRFVDYILAGQIVSQGDGIEARLVNTGVGLASGENARVIVQDSGAIFADVTGITVIGTVNRVDVSGSITAGGNGIELITSGGFFPSASVDITISGQITALGQTNTPVSNVGHGIVGTGGMTVRNTGEILAYNDGLHYQNFLVEQVNFANHGLVTAGRTGLDFGDADAVLTNSGTISGQDGILSGTGAMDIVNNGAILGSERGIVSLGGTVSLTNTGEIVGKDTGISLSNGTNTQVTNTGTISSNEQIVFIGGQNAGLTNSGLITGDGGVGMVGSGIELLNSGEIILDTNDGAFTFSNIILNGTSASLRNTGLIANANELGEIFLNGTDAKLFNSGTVLSTIAFNGEGARLRNDGLIDGDIKDGSGSFLAVNHGTISGDVKLEGGDDIYRGSGLVDGTVFGGGGDDKIHGGAADDMFNGGGNNDQLIGRDGDDTLIGDSGFDVLRGGRGDDALFGGAAGDTLIGGADNDSLTGGGNRDTFVFQRNNGDDVIEDFANGFDEIDLSAFGLNPSDYASVVVPALSDAGPGETLLDLSAIGAKGTVLIKGLSFADADASDFIL